MQSVTFTPIGVIRSPYTDIAGMPVQVAGAAGVVGTIELDPAARAWLAVKGFDRAFGARPMARLIERVVKKPLSELLLFGSLVDGGAVRVTVGNDEIKLVVGG